MVQRESSERVCGYRVARHIVVEKDIRGVNMRSDKVVQEKTKDWQPLMNKLPKNSRNKRKRLVSKRVRVEGSKYNKE